MEKINEYIEDVVQRLTKDDKLMDLFKNDPVKALEKVLGVDLPDDVVNGVIAGVKAKLTSDKISGVLGGLKNLF